MKNKIAFPIISYLGLFSSSAINYLFRFAQKLGLDIVILDSIEYNARFGIANHIKVISEFIGVSDFDGILIAPGYLSPLFSKEAIQTLMDQYQNRKIVSLCKKLDEHPSILVDNKSGIIEAIQHLVTVHQIREIAFITGPADNDEAIERFTAYKEGLALMGVPFQQELVYPGDFFVDTGTLLAKNLLRSETKLPRAVISSNDTLAIDFMNELLRHDVKIPEDVAIIGFDDIELASYHQVPLTTVRQPFEDILHSGLLTMQALLKDEEAISDTLLQTKLIIRNSCGCGLESLRIIQDNNFTRLEPTQIMEIIKSYQGQIRSTPVDIPWLHEFYLMLKGYNYSPSTESDLVSFFQAKIHALAHSLDGIFWHKTLTTLKNALFPDILAGGNPTEISGFLNLIDKFRLILSHQTESDLLFEIFNIYHGYNYSRAIINKIPTAQNKDEFIQSLTDFLQLYQYKKFSIYLFDSPIQVKQEEPVSLPGFLRLFYQFDQGISKPVQEKGPVISIKTTMQNLELQGTDCTTGYIKLINFRTLFYGIMVFDWRYELNDQFENLKQIISITLYSLRAIQMKDKIEKELLMKNEMLEELDTAKTNFFANISHELRTPLTLILGPLESLKQGEYGELVPKDSVIFKSMTQNSRRLLGLINNLLDFSKIEAGKMRAMKKAVDLYQFINFLVQSLESSFHSLGLTLSFDSKITRAVTIIDQDLMEKALMNLFSNALKFTPRGGQVTVELQEEQAQVGNSFYSITVRDTGIGIPEDKFDRLFERFSQLDQSSSRKYEGTGIGLAFTREIAVLHGGTVSVSSKVGEGSAFSLHIPVVTVPTDMFINLPQLTEKPVLNLSAFHETNPETFGEAPTIRTAQKNAPRILIVEDNADMRAFLTSILEKSYSLTTATNGQEGIDAALSDRPDLILTDVMMPEMDGYTMTHLIKLNENLKGIPVVMLTAKADTSMKIEGLEQGADDYVIKPFNARELRARINSNLEMKKLRDQVVMELNEKIAAQKSLEESERYFREMAEDLPGGIIEIGLFLQITYINKKGKELLGFETGSHLLNQDLSRFIITGDRDRFQNDMKKFILKESPVTYHYSLTAQNKSTYNVLLKVSRLHLNGSVNGLRLTLLAVESDITVTFLPDDAFFKKHLINDREKEVFTLLIQGYPSRDIAEKLFLSEISIRKYSSRIYEKFGVSSRAELQKVIRV